MFDPTLRSVYVLWLRYVNFILASTVFLNMHACTMYMQYLCLSDLNVFGSSGEATSI